MENGKLDIKDIKYGVIPKEPSSKIYSLSRVLPMATLDIPPDTFCFKDLSILKTRIKNQGLIGSCVGHSLSTTRELKEEQQKGVYVPFSPGFIYANRQATDYQGEGMIVEEALQNLLNSGDCFQTDFPFNLEYPEILSTFNPMKDSLLPKAIPYKITAYVYMSRDKIIEIKQAIKNLGPAVFVFGVHESFYNSINGVVTNPINTTTDFYYGSHAVALVGWTLDSWIIVNSWGTGYGDSGIFYIPFDYPYTSGIYSITDSIIDNYLVSNFKVEGFNKRGYIIPNESITITNTCINNNPIDTTYTWNYPELTKEGGIISFPTSGNYEIILDVNQASTGYSNRKVVKILVVDYEPIMTKKMFFYYKIRNGGF